MNKNQLLNRYGKPVLKSEYFEKARDQKHHLRSDVASHSINTARFCIRFYDVCSCFHIEMDLESLIVAALSHDLGMLDRDKKFSTKHDCYTRHPEESVEILKQIGVDYEEKVCDIISTHMFPLTVEKIPDCREAWILTFADKCAAATDWFAHYDIPDEK